MAFGLTLYIPHLINPEWISVTVNRDSLAYEGTMLLDFLFLRYAYISFFCLLAGLATVHLIYIISRNKCRRECPVLFS